MMNDDQELQKYINNLTGEVWRNFASSQYNKSISEKKSHEDAMNDVSHAIIKLSTEIIDQNRPGDEYYCSVHGGEGCLIDLKVKADLIVEKLGDWIVNQSDDIKISAAKVFGDELKLLGQTLQNMTDDTIRAAGLDPDEAGQRMKAAEDEG